MIKLRRARIDSLSLYTGKITSGLLIGSLEVNKENSGLSCVILSEWIDEPVDLAFLFEIKAFEQNNDKHRICQT